MSIITHSEMVTKLAKAGQDVHSDLTANSAHLWHMATGISGEAGELYEAIFNCEDYDCVNVINIVEELGDFEFYMEGFRQGTGIVREDTLYIVEDGPPIDVFTSEFSYSKSIFAELMMNANILLDATKKVAVYSKLIDFDSVTNTLAEIEYNLAQIRQMFAIEYLTTISNNIEKLYSSKNARYKEGKFSNQQAQDRADKA